MSNGVPVLWSLFRYPKFTPVTKLSKMAATDKESVLPQLQAEKDNLDPSFVHASKLISEELERVKSGKPKNQVEVKPEPMIDVHTGGPVKVSCKIRIPNREFPKLNFVGKLLGPKGQTMKDMQTNTGTKMYIYGKGSMRDKAKEEELRKEGGKHAHLSGDLHLHIEAFYPADEAYKRIASGIEEAKKYLDPQSFEQMQPDIPSLGGMDTGYGAGGGYQNGDGAGRGRGMGRGGPPGGTPRGGRGGSMLSPSRGGMSSRGAPTPRGGLGGAPRGGPGMRGAPSRGAPAGRGRGGPPVGRGRPEPLLDDGYGNSMGGGGGYEEPYQESYGADNSYGGDAGYGGQEQAGYGRESASTETYDYGHGSGGGGRDQYYEEPAYGGAPSGGRGGYSGGQSGGARAGGYGGQSSGPRGGGAGGYAGGQSGGRGGGGYGGGRGGGAGGDQWGSGAGRGMKAPTSRGGAMGVSLPERWMVKYGIVQ
ncbi:unnamed protein product [Owenia fusiformis]|uniref:K Homology domain-containing protein n=1 Tax=Owenia fusiformis TaxID=6347 RepID=A0A8S4N078_OWEFU|nr:unnamed protein product [Owenia fusiformis]